MTIRQILHSPQSVQLKCKVIAVISAAILTVLFGCSHTEKVLVPPKIDLKAYNAIGVIAFSSNAESELSEYATQNFIQALQSAQPGVRFLEIGSEKHVLTKISREHLDLPAIQSIGSVYHVDALLFGHLTVSGPKPKVHLSSTWKSMHAGALVEASLITKLWETGSGVLLWTNSSRGKEPVASLNADTSGNIDFGASDPKESYGQLVPELVFINTVDFRSYYVYQKVK